MKIGEAILEIQHLDARLDALQSRLLRDKEQGRPLNHVLQQIETAGNRRRDLRIALDWTYQQITVGQVPLGSYLVKRDQMDRLAHILESVDAPELRERVDELHEAKKETDRIVQAVYWAYDLMVPEVKVQKPEEEN